MNFEQFNFLKIEKERKYVFEYYHQSFYNNNISSAVVLSTEEQYIQYFLITENINTIDIKLFNGFSEIDFNYSVDIKDKSFILDFNFDKEFENCVNFVFTINGIKYYSNIFFINEIAKFDKNSIYITYWHTENYNNTLWNDHLTNFYTPQKIRIFLTYFTKKEEQDVVIHKNSFQSPNIEKSGRFKEYIRWIFKNISTVENHIAISRALSVDFVYIENDRFNKLSYKFEDDDGRNISKGTAELSKIWGDTLDQYTCENVLIDYFNYNIYNDGLVKIKYTTQNNKSNKLIVEISFNNIDWEIPLNFQNDGKNISYDLINPTEHFIRFTFTCIDNSQKIIIIEMANNYTLGEIKYITSSTAIPNAGWVEITEANIGNTINTVEIPNLLGKFLVGLKPSDSNFDAIANTGGEKQQTLIQGNLPDINITANITFPTSGDDNSGGFGNFNVSNNEPQGNQVYGLGIEIDGQSVPFSILNPYFTCRIFIYVGI